MYNTVEDRDKDLKVLSQQKGQLEASIKNAEKYLSLEDFKDYCDALYTCVGYIQKVQKSIKDCVIINNTCDTNEQQYYCNGE